MSALHQLTVTRELIATIASVRRPRRLKKPRQSRAAQPEKSRPKKLRRSYPARRIENPMNHHVWCRVSSHQGELRGFIPGSGWVPLQRRAVCQLLREAGPSAPAIVTLTVRQGVGYLTPTNRG